MYAFGPFWLDASRRVLLRDGRPVAITARTFDVLLALVRHPGETVNKDDLLRTVWPDTVVEEANLSQQIFTLRKILGQTDDNAYIATVPRRGYRWVADVTRTNGSASPDDSIRAAADRRRSTRLEIAIDPPIVLAGMPSPVLAISPDGSRLVFVGSDGQVTRLYLRLLDRFETVALDGTEDGANPFFSPDGSWLGFQSGRHLVKLPIDGGPAHILCDVVDVRGATWTVHGDIVYAPGPTTGLWRVPATGGTAMPLTTLEFGAGERTHRWPHALPDGGVIFTVGMAGATSFDEAALAVTRPGDRAHQTVLQHATDGRCLADGRLLWARGGAIFAAGFDLEGNRTVGSAQIVQNGVATTATGAAQIACSQNGTIVHVPGGAQTLRRSLVSVDRHGAETARHTTGDSLEEPRFAPDGRTAIVSLRSRSSDLWWYDFTSGALVRLTSEGENFAAVWGPDADTITYSASYGGPSDLFLLRPDRLAPPELLIASEFDKVAGAWSPDGTTLVFTEYHPDSGADIWVLDRATERARPFVRTRFNEYAPTFSPDGHHVAYVTDESGRPEVLVVSYPDAARRRQLSVDGGTEPIWSRDGKELFYRSGDRLMHVHVGNGIAHASVPITLFEGRFVPGTVTVPNYDASGDGLQFLMVAADVSPPSRVIRVTIPWPP